MPTAVSSDADSIPGIPGLLQSPILIGTAIQAHAWHLIHLFSHPWCKWEVHQLSPVAGVFTDRKIPEPLEAVANYERFRGRYRNVWSERKEKSFSQKFSFSAGNVRALTGSLRLGFILSMVLLTVRSVPSSSCLTSGLSCFSHADTNTYTSLWISNPFLNLGPRHFLCHLVPDSDQDWTKNVSVSQCFRTSFHIWKRKWEHHDFFPFLYSCHCCISAYSLYVCMETPLSLKSVFTLPQTFTRLSSSGSLMLITEEILVIVVRKCPGDTGPSCLVLNRDAYKHRASSCYENL